MAHAAFVFSFSSYEAVTKAFIRDTKTEAHGAAKAAYLDEMLQSGNWIDYDDCVEAYQYDEDEGNLEIMTIEVAA